MARRILNRKEMRADFDAAERKKEEEETDESEEETEDEDEDEEEGDGDGDADAEGGDEEGEGDDEGEDGDEDAPRKKKKKPAKVKVAKPKAKPRSRAAKVVRMKVVWGVFSNSNQRVAVYDYPRKADAEAHARKLTEDKKSTHFVQPVKEQMEEKKD